LKITTSRFGELDIDAARVLTFIEGILGFPQYLKYVLLDHDKNTPFKWLQSIENGELAFVLIDPLTVLPDYRAEVRQEDIDALQITGLERAVALCIVNIGPGAASVTANLLGPIIINPESMLARQIVLMTSQYSIQHDLLAVEPQQNVAAAK
jgi:flagellar assembly factor FliW